MSQIGNVPEIIEVKDRLEAMRKDGLVKVWELPYENLLTRRSAAIFFLSPVSLDCLDEIWQQLSRFEYFSSSKNIEKTLSSLEYKIEFKKEND